MLPFFLELSLHLSGDSSVSPEDTLFNLKRFHPGNLREAGDEGKQLRSDENPPHTR